MTDKVKDEMHFFYLLQIAEMIPMGQILKDMSDNDNFV